MDNMLDVGALLEDAENRGGMLDHVDDLQDHNTQVSPPAKHKQYVHDFEEASVLWGWICFYVLQLSARLDEIQKEAAERISELETQLMQAAKETELLKVTAWHIIQ